ncbi:DsbA family protein (plasmid) [Streptomyces sp. NBC_01590]|uniref:thioredoxin domain-containing protein n=1 Tax=Streptomyces sp. NBC_01590 TaxID=2975887 RepID=UPI002F9077DD
MTSTSAPTSLRRNRKRTILASGVLVAALATAAFALTLDGSDTATTKPAAQPPAVVTEPGESAPADDSLLALARREKTDPLAVGRADAPVVMIEYTDFQCPFCGQCARRTEPDLVRSYVDKGMASYTTVSSVLTAVREALRRLARVECSRL